MTTTLDHLVDCLREARAAATLERASFGFSNDRIEIKSVHFGDDRTGRVGDVLHPDEYIKRITALYRDTWIIPRIDEALRLVEANRELLRQCEELREHLGRANIPALLELARAGMKD